MFHWLKRAASSIANASPGKLRLYADAADNLFKTRDEAGVVRVLGDGITTITLVSTVGRVKTYRITRQSGETFDYTVTDGQDGAVTAFNGRTGNITPQQADYDGFFLTQAEGDAAYQPLDSDLSAIAALATTPYGRSQLTYAGSAAATAALDLASSALKGLMSSANFLKLAGLYFDAKTDGGATGNGSTDDLAAINNLIASVPSGSTIWFQPGTYQLSGAINIPAGKIITLRGASRFVSVLRTSSATADIITVNEWFFSCIGLGFDSSVTRTAGFAVNNTKTPINSYMLVQACRFLNQWNCIGADGTVDYIDDCEMREFRNAGIIKNSASDFTINKVVMDNTTAPATGGVVIRRAGSVQITNCNIIRSNVCLDIDATTTGGVFAVYCTNTYWDSARIGMRIAGSQPVQRIKMTNCWFCSHSEQGVLIANGQANGIDITNSDILGNPGGGLVASAFSEFSVAQCRVAGNGVAGISITASSGGQFSLNNNTVGNTSGFGTNPVGIAVGAGSYTSYQIIGNDLSGNTTALTDAGTATGGKAIRANLPGAVSVASLTDTAFAATLVTAATLTIQGGAIHQAAAFEFEVYGSVINTTAASNLVANLTVNGTVVATATVALGTGAVASPGRGFAIQGRVTFRAVGASGSVIGHVLSCVNNVVPGISNQVTPTAVNTTAPVTLAITIQTSAATSTGTIRQAAIEPAE